MSYVTKSVNSQQCYNAMLQESSGMAAGDSGVSHIKSTLVTLVSGGMWIGGQRNSIHTMYYKNT